MPQKSGAQTALKVISIIMIILAVISIIGGLGFAGLGLSSVAVLGAEEMTDEMYLGAGLVSVLGAIVIVQGVVDLIIAILGLRGANNPSKIGAFLVICYIGLILYIISLVAGLVMGSFSMSTLASLVLVIVCLLLARSIKKQARGY